MCVYKKLRENSWRTDVWHSICGIKRIICGLQRPQVVDHT